MNRLLTFVGLLLLPLHAGAAFPDVPATHESRRAIEYLQEAGVLRGHPDGLFRPAFSVNRAELLKILIAARGIEPPADLYARCFPDVTTQWFAPYVCMAALQGWVQGYPDGTFGPERPVAFAEALKMVANVRGYPLAPAEESRRRGIDPASWFAPYLTTMLLLDVVSYGQVWGDAALPLHAPLDRGTVAEFLYRAFLAEGGYRATLSIADCAALPTHLEIRTYVDVLLPEKTNIFRQELRAVDQAGNGCVLAPDANPFGRVTPAFDAAFLQPYPGGQPTDVWTIRVPLLDGRAVLRGGTLDGTFRPEVFVADVFGGALTQLPSIYAAVGETVVSPDRRYVAYVGVAGRTLEAIDLFQGRHVLIDAVQPPQTFLAASESVPNIVLTGSALVGYTVYDASVATSGGYAVLESRSVNLDELFSVQNPFDGPPIDNPFDDFGDTATPVFP